MIPIDLLVGAYGFAADIEQHMNTYMNSLQSHCNLQDVNIIFIERKCRPLSFELKTNIQQRGFTVVTSPLPVYDNVFEDTGQFCNWMVNNCVTSDWFGISHYDIVFKGDFISWVRQYTPLYSIIGDHHDGIVFVNYEDYQKCGVGFLTASDICTIPAGNDIRVVPTNYPHAEHGRRLLYLDVGELLSIRMNSLYMNHKRFYRESDINDIGKHDMFDHIRQGSGHGI